MQPQGKGRVLAGRIRELRSTGIRTVMIPGDNPMTAAAAAIAIEVGADFLVEAKLALIRANTRAFAGS